MLTRTSKLLAVLMLVAAVGGRAVSSGTVLRLSQQSKPQRPRTAGYPQRVTMPHVVSFREVRGRGLLVNTWINSAGPFTFAVDTGAGITILSPRVVSEARVAIKSGPGVSIAGLSGTVVSAQAGTVLHLQSLHLGSMNSSPVSQQRLALQTWAGSKIRGSFRMRHAPRRLV